MSCLTISLVHDKESAIHFLQTHGIIHNQRFCRNGHLMSLSTASDRWRCHHRGCRHEIGLRKGTWLQKSKLELRMVVLFLYYWSKQLTSIQFCQEQLSISAPTVVDWNNFLREVCAWRLLQTQTLVGGPDLHVEIDETFISCRKNHAGIVSPQQWIFGGICRETNEVFMYAVPDNTAATLHEAIRACIVPGSIIISDMWASYNGIEAMLGMEYTQQTLNYTTNFVDPDPGVKTQITEPFWQPYKMQNKRHCGTHRGMVTSYLCEFMWRQKYQENDLFMQILNDINGFHRLEFCIAA